MVWSTYKSQINILIILFLFWPRKYFSKIVLFNSETSCIGHILSLFLDKLLLNIYISKRKNTTQIGKRENKNNPILKRCANKVIGWEQRSCQKTEGEQQCWNKGGWKRIVYQLWGVNHPSHTAGSNWLMSSRYSETCKQPSPILLT